MPRDPDLAGERCRLVRALHQARKASRQASAAARHAWTAYFAAHHQDPFDAEVVVNARAEYYKLADESSGRHSEERLVRIQLDIANAGSLRGMPRLED